MKTRPRACIVSILIALGLACAERDPNDLFAPEAGTIVVDAFLVVGQRFPDIVLSQTVAPNVPFSRQAAALPGASVRISGGGVTLDYVEAAFRGAGVYAPTTAEFVSESTVYRLDLTAADGRRVRASTLTPRAFSVGEWALLDNAGQSVIRRLASFADYGDSVYTRPENQLVYSLGLLEARFDPRDIAGFQVGLFSTSPGSAIIIDPDFLDEEDLADLPRTNSSPPLEALDGTVRLPWFAIFFEGKYLFKVWAMDRNWFDLARTEPTLSGGGFGFGGQAGDYFERPIFHIDGGIGLFGSGAVDSAGVTIHPRP
ncbi:MAG: DUF4249 domain-containing protein [Candidatus Krumholzibacteria bacterium]|nr:DUF4249 domain-containing protein [Candidatus Krumholzibacteria bacterium]